MATSRPAASISDASGMRMRGQIHVRIVRGSLGGSGAQKGGTPPSPVASSMPDAKAAADVAAAADSCPTPWWAAAAWATAAAGPASP
jgi:hypothetical protein